jgi:hypothetical protein
VIPALRRLRQEDGEFKVSYIQRPELKKKRIINTIYYNCFWPLELK